MYQHSMVRLQSRVARSISAGSPMAEDSAAEDLAAAEAGRAAGGEQAAGVAEAEPEQVLEGPADSGSTQQSGQKQAAAQQSTAAFQSSAVRVVARQGCPALYILLLACLSSRLPSPVCALAAASTHC
jgi:membrane protease subunit (stomatin/prohibitin family)